VIDPRGVWLGAGGPGLLIDRFLGLAQQDRHQGAQALALVLAEFDRQNFGGPHLDVQEFDDLAQFGRDAVGDKQHADTPCHQVRGDFSPERIKVPIGAQLLGEGLGRALARGGARGKADLPNHIAEARLDDRTPLVRADKLAGRLTP
jgi:hypothetical protein